MKETLDAFLERKDSEQATMWKEFSDVMQHEMVQRKD